MTSDLCKHVPNNVRYAIISYEKVLNKNGCFKNCIQIFVAKNKKSKNDSL